MNSDEARERLARALCEHDGEDYEARRTRDDHGIWVGYANATWDEGWRPAPVDAGGAAQPAELVIEPARPDTDKRTVRHARCSLCSWSMDSTSREDIKARFVEHARDKHGTANDAPYWKQLAEQWHKHYLDALDERDAARLQRDALQSGAADPLTADVRPTVVLTHSGPGPLPKEMAERIAKAVNPSMTGEHRNGCDGCENVPGEYPHCWTKEEIAADWGRIKRFMEGGVAIPQSPRPKAAPSIPWVIEGFEPRTWFSPTEGYFTYEFWNAIGEMRMLRARDRRMVRTLPDDAHEIGSYPTRYAYERACTALAQHRERADNLEGRHKALRDKIMPVIGGDWTIGPPPLEVAVDALIHLARISPKIHENNQQSLIGMEKQRDAWKEAAGVDRRDIDTTPAKARAEIERLRVELSDAKRRLAASTPVPKPDGPW